MAGEKPGQAVRAMRRFYEAGMGAYAPLGTGGAHEDSTEAGPERVEQEERDGGGVLGA